MRFLGTVAFLSLLAAVLGAAWAEMHGEHASLEQLVVESADTPQEHEALASYYRGKAEHMNQMAAEHRSMAQAYTGTKMMQGQAMKSHCSELATRFEKAAADYEAMAKAHEEAAGQPGSGTME